MWEIILLFENTKISIEAHIFDFDQDIYERQVRFFFLKRRGMRFVLMVLKP